MINKTIKILKEIIPILIMISLIPLITNDYLLASIYIIIIILALFIKREKGDFVFMFFGFFAMIISESIFISTGVETFVRNSLFGLMPMWLPFLWAYAFVVMRRSVKIIGV
jgi:hypothetical protein